MDDDVAIKVNHVSKNFILPHERVTSVKGMFTNLAKGKMWKIKETQHALRDVSFEVKKGEFFGIVGRNGSGKSTLLKMLAGIYQPTKGKITTRGKLVPFIELGVGFNPELTGRENVYLNGAMLGFSKRQIDSMYDEIVAFAELEKFMDQKLKNYSSGMQVRLAFSMAVRSEADILLIDEVLAVGDADFQRKCYAYFKTLKRDKKTVVFVSHDMDAVREYCDRVMLIEKSATVHVGEPERVAEEYAKLFAVNTQTDNGKEAPTNRWGDCALITKRISVNVTARLITVSQTIKAASDMEKPVLGIRVRDLSGKSVLGTNTKIEAQPPLTFKEGDSKVLVWEFPNILAQGEYTVDPAILYADAVTVADWWDGAVRFQINKKRHLPYAIDPGFKVGVKDD